MRILHILLLAFLSFNVWGGVNLKNGNFHISYTDISLERAPEPLEIVRTYNSRATTVGWFGMGWGSDYETRLIATPEGGVVIRENGSGSSTWFGTAQPPDMDTAVERIVAAMRAGGTVTDDAAAATLRQQLKSDAELRVKRALQHGITADIPVGTILYSYTRGPQKVQRTRDGYTRTSEGDNRVEYFSSNGQLIRISDPQKGATVIEYRKGRAHSIRDGHGQKIFLAWTPEGLVKRLWSGRKNPATYHYQGIDLAESRDVGGNRYIYAYDDNHNLTSVLYEDGSSMRIDYSPDTSMVAKLHNREGGVTEYRYGANPQNAEMHYWTKIVTTDVDSDPWLQRYEYENRTRPDGTSYTYRMVVDIDGDHEERIYSECCEQPVRITRNDQTVEFEYDARGKLLQRKDSDGQFIRLAYHPELGKVTRIENNDAWSSYTYNAKGDLASAENHEGLRVEMTYDNKGRVAAVMDDSADLAEKRSISFKYNRLNKPVRITVEKLGAITVTYQRNGDIRKVSSTGGPEVAMNVTAAFQKLLMLVKPAGVSLGF